MNPVVEDAAGANAAADNSVSDEVKTKAPAKVSVTSFVLYRVTGPSTDPEPAVTVLHGGVAARYTPEGKLQLLAGSVPFHSEAFNRFAPKPGHAMLALYGHRDGLEELQFWRAKARQLGCDFAYVNYDVEVGKILSGLVDRAMMRENQDVRFLNLRRAKSTLQQQILERFAAYVSEEGPNTTMTSVSHIASRPDLYDRLFQDDKDFRHLSVFVTPVADDLDAPGKMRQVAYIRSNATVLNMDQGDDQIDVLLPSWLTDEKAAKKVRALMGS